ncbi:MAG: hypothetical protein QOH00_209 [Gaiellales bacterium]|jgi:hypothetical protein|nr:hypothetical protein [Gaiellales bacterium]
MSYENPDWRLEIWHAGAKAAEISNDEWERVLSDLVQFSETRRREVQRGPAPANGNGADAEAEVETEAEAEAEVEDEAEDEALAEPPSTYWAHFAAAAIQRKEVTPESAATMADELLDEYVKRFPEAA